MMSGSGDVLYPHRHHFLIIVTPLLAKVLRRFAEEIQGTAHLGRGNSFMLNLDLRMQFSEGGVVFQFKTHINVASITLPLIFGPPLHRLQYPHNISLEMDHQAQEIPPQNLRQ